MKKAILATFLTLAGSAMAQTSAAYMRYCGIVSESSWILVQGAKQGIPLSEFRSVRDGLRSKKPQMRPVNDMAEAIETKAYYEWVSLDEKTVKQFAFMHCSMKEREVFEEVVGNMRPE